MSTRKTTKAETDPAPDPFLESRAGPVLQRLIACELLWYAVGREMGLR